MIFVFGRDNLIISSTILINLQINYFQYLKIGEFFEFVKFLSESHPF